MWNTDDGIMDPRTVREELRGFFRTWDTRSSYHNDRVLARRVKGLRGILDALERECAVLDERDAVKQTDPNDYWAKLMADWVRGYTKQPHLRIPHNTVREYLDEMIAKARKP